MHYNFNPWQRAQSLWQTLIAVPANPQPYRSWTRTLFGLGWTVLISVLIFAQFSIADILSDAFAWSFTLGFRCLLTLGGGVWICVASPTRDTTPEEQRQGATTNSVLLFLFVMTFALMVFDPRVSSGSLAALSYWAFGITTILQMRWLVQHGFVHLGTTLLLVGLWLNGLSIIGGGPTALSQQLEVPNYVLVTACVGLLASWRAGLLTAVTLPLVAALLQRIGLAPGNVDVSRTGLLVIVLSVCTALIALSQANPHANAVAHLQRDPLTKLFHRGSLAEAATRIALAHQHIGVLMIDIDHFKQINDTYGHFAGDHVLQEVAILLQGALRADDWACRYGGEEFAVLLPSIDLAVLVTRAQVLCERVRELQIIYRDQGIYVTVSIGAAHYLTHGQTVMQALEAADGALYAAKRTGRDRVCVVGECA